MSYYAKTVQGIVETVIVADELYISHHLLDVPGEDWVLTSYNTYGNVHYGPDGKPDGQPPFRGNYACIGYTWDPENDVFYAPQPYPSWILSRETWLWDAPVPYPEAPGHFKWDESIKNWVPVNQEGK